MSNRRRVPAHSYTEGAEAKCTFPNCACAKTELGAKLICNAGTMNYKYVPHSTVSASDTGEFKPNTAQEKDDFKKSIEDCICGIQNGFGQSIKEITPEAYKLIVKGILEIFEPLQKENEQLKAEVERLKNGF